MRVDLFLKRARLILQRKYSKEACKEGFVFVNGKKAKASTKIKTGDIIELKLPLRYVKVKVLKIPPRPLNKNEVEKFVEFIEIKKRNIKEFFSED